MGRLNLKNIITSSRRNLLIGGALLLGAAAWGASVVHLPPVVTSGVQVTGATGSTAAVFDSSKNLGSSAVTSTELGYVSGVTSSLCGINQSCTLTNKALTSPSMSNPAVTGALSLPDGTVSAPSLTFTSETNSGLYRIGAKDVGLSIDGVLGLEAVKDSTNTYTNLGVGGAANTDPQYLLQASRTLNGSAFLVGLNFSNGAAAEVGNRFINAQSHAGDVILTAGAYSEANIADRLVLEGRGTAGVTIAADQSTGTIDSLIGGYASTNLVTKTSSWGQYVNGAMSIGTTSPNASAILDLTSTTKGFLPPRMTSTQKGSLTGVEGLSIWDTTNHIPWSYDGTEWVATGVPYASVGNTGYVLGSAGGFAVNSWVNTLNAFTLTNMNTSYGTASNSQRLVLPSASTSTLSGLTNTAALIAYDTTQAKPVFNNGSGWTTIGTGSGGATNFIGNPDAESGTTGWATYADAAGTKPVDGTGGSPTTTWTQSSSSPLSGTDSFLLTKDAANRQGEGASYDFTIDAANEARVEQISFDYEVGSGTFVAGSSSTDSDVEVYIYDKTNSVLIQPSTYKLYSNSSSVPTHFLANFQTASNSTSYRLIFHVATTSASAYTVKFDSITVAPSTYTYGTPITDWKSWTPTGSWSTNTTYTGQWRRVGDSMEANINIALAGAPTAASLTVNLPSGYTIDTSKLANGSNSLFSGSTAEILTATQSLGYFGGAYYNSTTSLLIKTIRSTADWITVDATHPGTFASGDGLNITFKVPILGWSSSVQMSDSAAQSVVAAIANNVTAGGFTASTWSIPTFGTVVKDSVGGFNAASNVTSYTARVAGFYNVNAMVQIQPASVTVGTSNKISVFVNSVETKTYRQDVTNSSILIYDLPIRAKVYCNAGDIIQIKVWSTGTSPAFNNTSVDGYFDVSYDTGNQTIGATETVAATYVNTSAQSISNNSLTTITGWTKEFDDHGMCTASGVCALPVAGKYRATESVGYASTFTSNTGELDAIIVPSGCNSASNASNEVVFPTTGQGSPTAVASKIFFCNAGDTLTFKTLQLNGTARALSNSATLNYFSVERIGM